MLRHVGDRQAVLTSLRRAIEADSRYTPALINLAVETFSRADVAGAERLIRRALEVDPQDAFACLWLCELTLLSGRYEEALAAADRISRLSSDPFYVTGSQSVRAVVHFARGDVAAAERAIREGLARGAAAPAMHALEAAIAAHAGRIEEARRLTADLESTPGLATGSLIVAADAALRVGETERAIRFLSRSILTDLSPVIVRLDPELHALLDREPFAPRRLDATLVWPLEAPPIDDAQRALFKDVRVESGVPKGSDVGAG